MSRHSKSRRANRQDPPLSSHEEVLSEQDLQLLRPMLRKRRIWPPILLWACLALLAVPLPLLLLMLAVHYPQDFVDYWWLWIMITATSLYMVYLVVSQFRRMLHTLRHSANLPSTSLRKQVINSTLLVIEPGSTCGVAYQLYDRRIEVSLPGHHHLAFNDIMGDLPKSAHARLGSRVSLHLLQLPGGSLPLLLRADYHDSPITLTHTTRIGASDYRELRSQLASLWKWMLGLAGLSLLLGLLLDGLMQALALSGVAFWLLLAVLGTMLMLWPWLWSSSKFQVEGQIDEMLWYQICGKGAPQSVYYCRIGGVLYKMLERYPLPVLGTRLTMEYLLRRDDVTLEPLTLKITSNHSHG